MKLVVACALTMSMLALAPVGAAAKKEFRPAKYQKDGWVTRCWAGEDGSAANCEAKKSASPYMFQLSAVDEQLFVEIKHPRCEVEYRSRIRDELFGLSLKARRDQTINDLDLLTLELKKKCPSLPAVARTFLNPPDIAPSGDEVLR